MRHNTTIRLAFVAGMIALMLCSTASAVTHTVCASGCDFTTIQAAVTAASSYDIIEVQAGTYSENVHIVTARLTIEGAGMATTHVEAASSIDHVFDVDASYTNITGMNITGATSSGMANIHLDGDYDYCNFSYNRIADCYDGIVIRGTGNDHNLVLNNTLTKYTDLGIMIRDSSYSNATLNNMHHGAHSSIFWDVDRCYVYSNWIKHQTGRGLRIQGAVTNTFLYNNWVENCSENGHDGGASASWNIAKRSGTNIFGGNYIGGNYWDDYAGVDNDNDGLGNTLTPYTAGGGITVGGDYHPLCTAAGGGGAGTRNCANGDICVNQTHWWRDDAPINASADPITGGIGAATQGQTVYIFNGTYTENIAESDTPHLTVNGEGRDVVHITPTIATTHIIAISGNADYFNITGVHVSGGTDIYGIYFLSVSYGNVTNCNASDVVCCGIVGQYCDYMNVVGNIVCNNTIRGITFPYYSNHSYFADNIIMDNAGRGLDLCTHGDDTVFRNNTVLRNGLLTACSHSSGINTHWSDNILYDECRSYGNYGFRDYLIRNDANNITIRNPANPVGESFDFDIENSDCEWKIENTDGQIFTESSGATAYTYPSNFSMQRKNAAETFTVTLTPMTLLSTDDQVTVTSISYNNAMYSEEYRITADCTDAFETVTFTAHVANTTGEYMCYVDGSIDHGETAIDGVVTWTYAGGFASPKALSILWGSGGGPSGGFIPPDPTNIQHTTGNFWVRHSWSPGAGTDTDSYNVSANSVWHNITTNTFWNAAGLSAHAWSNITVYAWNATATGNLSTGYITQDTQIPNNPITITDTSDWSGDTGGNVHVDYDSTDADSDTPVFSCNRLDMFTDFNSATGVGNWVAGANGTYHVDFSVADGYGSTSHYLMTIQVGDVPPSTLRGTMDANAAAAYSLAGIMPIIAIAIAILGMLGLLMYGGELGTEAIVAALSVVLLLVVLYVGLNIMSNIPG